MRILGLIVSLGIVMYLVMSSVMRSNSPQPPSSREQNLLDQPAAIKDQVNKAFDAAEKSRQNALPPSP